MTILLEHNLRLERCPHCQVANPNLFKQHQIETTDSRRLFERIWFIYTCGSCGGLVTAWAPKGRADVKEIFPSPKQVDDDIPDKPKAYLKQAMESIHASAGAVMLAGSAVDSMLKMKGYVDGSLYARIEKAAQDHLITSSMSQWAHEVRLDANDQRHADENAALPNQEDAKRVIDFALALADFIFVLPSRVQRGLNQKKS